MRNSKDLYLEGGEEAMLDMFLGNDRAIEDQEAREQSRMISKVQLPTEINQPHNIGAKEVYKKLGIEITGQENDLFYNVVLPEGWKLEPTDHSMWSDLLDHKGRKRASIFYKGAFYDRSSHLNLEKRFGVRFFPEDHYKKNIPHEDRRNGLWRGEVTDCENVRWHTDWIDGKTYENNVTTKHDYEEKHLSECKKYLEENFPLYDDHFAYWED